MAYFVAELKQSETGGFAPRGGAKELWRYKGPEVLLSGPAETGKTFTCCTKLHALLAKYPNAQGAMIRKTQASLLGSCVRTYQRVIGQDSPVVAFGGSKPEWFDYPNGSRLWLGGMDNPAKVLSSERDFIYVCQAEELNVEDWETLTTRNTGRGSVAPYTQMLADANPGSPTHWLLQRRKAGSLRIFESRHEDNPTLFDEQGNITEQGIKSLASLDALTGVRKKRLRYGLWVSAEGQVYETYDPAVHLIARNDPRYGLQNGVPDFWPRDWCIDFGYTNPFVWQEWVTDPDGRIFLHREIYFTGRTVAEHCKTIRELTSNSPRPRFVVCDHDAEDRATLENELGVTTIAAYKAVTTGIQAVENRLKTAGDSKPRLLILEDALVERDESLADRKLPICTADEIGEYVWDTTKGFGIKEVPVKRNDHGCDDLRYMVAHADGLNSTSFEVRFSK